ncbi:MAG: hypothetical protein ACP5NK_07625 [Thermoplasmata archaeon]
MARLKSKRKLLSFILIETNSFNGERNVPQEVYENIADQVHVIKMGGSVLFSDESIEKAISAFSFSYRQNVRYVIVNSALKGVTDILYRLIEINGTTEAEELLDSLGKLHLTLLKSLEIDHYIEELRGDLRTLEENGETSLRDKILSYGERLSALILSRRLANHGFENVVVDAFDIIRVDEEGNPRSEVIKYSIEKMLSSTYSRIIIVPGYYGSDPDGNVRTLGRGGSDLTAALISKASGSTALDLWKDVDGIYSADPSFIYTAVRFNRISKELAEKMMSLKAKIIHPLALKHVDLEKSRICVRGIRGSPVGGTEIVREYTDKFFLIVVNEFTEFIDSRDFRKDHSQAMEDLEKFISSENENMWVYRGIVRNSVIVLHPGEKYYASVLPADFTRVTVSVNSDNAVIVLVNEGSFRDELFDDVVTEAYNRFRKTGIKDMAFKGRSRMLLVKRELLQTVAEEIHSKIVELMI